MTREKCSHEHCQCDVETAFGRYCSEACAAAGRHAAARDEAPCLCGHPDCA